ncbi:EI24 domain-containing protein [Sphingobium boeckii]|uniref:Uncharacterized protein involved in cysteine biosynthesis n=1 Tax=Sphingobium boeckii TaxID=1082345 RepID=A0A7W9EDP0_9SPHN|nr:EI24 domain-containing protein [Sphingobium boeckii]MBB5684170.1 uncharacterized protein involved in cysteine biosynthesis [Sphingobium boeckii]
MIRAFFLSLGQLSDPAILKVLAKVIALTLLIFILLGALLWFGVSRWIGTDFWAGESDLYGLAALTGLAVFGGTWLFFRAVAVAVMGLFADGVVAAVERRHYPAVASDARNPSMSLSLRMGLASMLRAILFNLLALPLYVLLLVTGVGTIALFALVNALLLGRDLGEMVAVRHMDAGAVRGWLETTRTQRLVLGLVVTGLFVVPFVNLLAPVIGAAMATHLYHGKRI